MTIEPKLMDPERLAHLEHEESLMRVSMIPQSVLTVAQLIRELRGHAKHWEAEANRAKHDLARTVTRALFAESCRDSTLDELKLVQSDLTIELELADRSTEIISGLVERNRRRKAADRAEIKKFRERCTVEASDVKAAGVTWAQCYAVFMREIPDHRAFLAGLLGVMCTASEAMTMDFEPPEDPHEPIAGCVFYIEMFTDMDRWAILAEMAAMDPS